MSHNVPSQYIKECKINNVFYDKMKAGGHMTNGTTKILDNGIIFHSFTMGELLISVLLLIIIIILLVNINKKD